MRRDRLDALGRPDQPARYKNPAETARIAERRRIALLSDNTNFVMGFVYKYRWWMQCFTSLQRRYNAIEANVDLKEDRDGALGALRKEIEHALDKANEAARDGAPYIHPRLVAMKIDMRHTLDLTKLSDKDLDDLERIVGMAGRLADQSGNNGGAGGAAPQA